MEKRVTDLWIPVHLVVDGPDPTQDDLHRLGRHVLELRGQLQQLVWLHFLCTSFVQEVHHHTAEKAVAFIRHSYHTHPIQEEVNLYKEKNASDCPPETFPI